MNRDLTPAQSASIARCFKRLRFGPDWLNASSLFIGALFLGFALCAAILIVSAIERAAHDAHQIRTLGYVAMMEMNHD